MQFTTYMYIMFYRLASSYSDSGMESSENELSHSYDILPDMDFGMFF